MASVKEENAEAISVRMYDINAEDPLERERGRCLANDCEVRKVFLELRECTERVTRKIKYTAEDCSQETRDLAMALDHCVHDIAFSKLA